MATYTLAASDLGAYDKTLAASTVDTVTWTGTTVEWVRVFNEGGAGLYVTTDGTNPTVSGGATVKVAPATFAIIRGPRDGPTSVKLISATAGAYSVSVSGAPQ